MLGLTWGQAWVASRFAWGFSEFYSGLTWDFLTSKYACCFKEFVTGLLIDWKIESSFKGDSKVKFLKLKFQNFIQNKEVWIGKI
jgi:hypothetical protein